MIKLLVLCIASIISLKVNAGFRHFLFAPATPVKIESGEITFNDSTTSVDLNVSGGPNGEHLGRVLLSECSGQSFDDGDSATQNKTAWLIIPNRIKVNGVRIITDILDYNEWHEPMQEIPFGYVAKVVQKKIYGGDLSGCWNPGANQMVDFFWRDAKLEITVPKQKLLPGTYNVSIPYYYGYEEYKFTDDHNPISPPGIPSQIITDGGAKGNLDITVKVESKCKLDTSQISLSHNIMSGSSADGNQTKPYNINVSCTPGTSLSVKLLGSQKVSGKTDNYTQCGTGGVCELTFDNGKYDEIMTVDNSKTLSIKSTYHLNDFTKPVAESFEGSGVLQVLVN